MIKLAKNLLLTLVLAGMAHAGLVDYEYVIQVNTSELTSDTGYLDLQLNPGSPAPSDTTYAYLTDFDTDGTLDPSAPDGGPSGDVTGELPGEVTIENGTVYNDYNEGFTFGSFFDIFVTLSVPDITGTADSGSSFALTLYEDDDATSYLTTATGDPLVEIDLNAGGSPTVTNNSPDGEADVSAVPEPASFALVGLGLTALLAARRRKTA